MAVDRNCCILLDGLRSWLTWEFFECYNVIINYSKIHAMSCCYWQCQVKTESHTAKFIGTSFGNRYCWKVVDLVCSIDPVWQLTAGHAKYLLCYSLYFTRLSKTGCLSQFCTVWLSKPLQGQQCLDQGWISSGENQTPCGLQTPREVTLLTVAVWQHAILQKLLFRPPLFHYCPRPWSTANVFFNQSWIFLWNVAPWVNPLTASVLLKSISLSYKCLSGWAISVMGPYRLHSYETSATFTYWPTTSVVL